MASNGVEAVELYKKGLFDLVLMDINMPLQDGLSATKEIIKAQQDDGLYKVPIVALTANSISGDREKYLEAGMDDYLSKPIEFDKLILIMEKYLKNRDAKSSVVVEESKVNFSKYTKNDAIKQLSLNESIVDMLLDSFFLTLDEDLEKLQNALDEKDSDAISKAAHYIKGSCANLAMKEPTEILKDIETRAKNGENSGFNLNRLKAIFQTIKDEV